MRKEIKMFYQVEFIRFSVNQNDDKYKFLKEECLVYSLL